MTDTTERGLHDLRGMSGRDFALWGMQDVAFVKKAASDDDGAEKWAIYAADGTQVGEAPNRELAMAAVRQHELEAFSVH